MSPAPGTRTHAVIAGGGTAGHVLPALAVADALVDRGHRAEEIHYIGARRGIEAELLPGTGYPHTLLDVVGLQRRVTVANLAFLPLLVRAVARTRLLLRRLRRLCGMRLLVSVVRGLGMRWLMVSGLGMAPSLLIRTTSFTSCLCILSIRLWCF